jgi:hypothetical protein
VPPKSIKGMKIKWNPDLGLVSTDQEIKFGGNIISARHSAKS